MLARSVLRRACAPLSSAVPIVATDAAFLYPRFQAADVLSDSLPELKETKRLVAAAGGTHENDKAIAENLRRANEIFRNLCPDGEPGGPNTPAYIIKDWAGVGAAYGRHDGLARTPRRDWERMRLLAPLVDLTETAPLDDLAVFDSMCSVVAAYADAALRIVTYGEGGIGSLQSLTGKPENLDAFKSPDAEKGIVTFEQLCAAVDRLTDAAYTNAVQHQHDETIRSIRVTYSKLCALRALLEIPFTGALQTSIEIIDRPSRLRGQSIETLSLLVAMRAEIRTRLEAGSWGVDCMDELVSHEYNFALERIHYNFPRSRPDNGIKMEGLETMRDAYCSCALAKAAYLLGLPKDPKGDAPGVYTHHASRQLSMSPILMVPSGGPLVMEASTRVSMKARRAKNFALQEVERALKMNRELYPHDRQNLKAGYLLRFIACNYAEVKDYIYANGLFNSCVNTFTAHYGAESLEVAEVLRWHEGYHRFVGSTQEADAQLNRINYIREQNDVGPVESIADAGVMKERKGPEFRAPATEAKH
mmetsp:Transcript_13874/g.43184  ORF Transcript_13874/g.43184 Transcript_13874/m.43184 type:complete len:532 (-) Transcript_13874:158-1753(-)